MIKKISLCLMSLLISGVALSAAPKQKDCNDLKIDRCKQRKECTWVDENKTKDGKTVKAYCKCKGKCEK